MFCNSCGNRIEQWEQYCTGCGTRTGYTPVQTSSQSTSPMTLSNEELQREYDKYNKRMWFSFFGPVGGIFLIVVVWGFMALMEEMIRTNPIISALDKVFDVFIPIALAFFFLVIPVGIILGIVFSQERSRAQHLLMQKLQQH